MIRHISHNPLKTVEILKYFAQNEHFKFTTHNWDYRRYETYEDFIDKIKKEWIIIDNDLKTLSKNLHTKIYCFLFNENFGQKDSCENLCFGWSSPELKKFMNEHKNRNPFNCPIPEYIKTKNDDKLSYFKDCINIFKNEFEFREDTKNLRKMFVELWESELDYQFNLHGLENMENFSFYTDVQYIKEAIKIIFNLFKNNSNFNNIQLKRTSNYENLPYYHLITITQSDLFVNSSPEKLELENLNLIINKLNNLCDYSIVSKFDNGEYYRINYLSLENKPKIEKIDFNNEIIGFTHELKFYL